MWHLLWCPNHEKRLWVRGRKDIPVLGVSGGSHVQSSAPSLSSHTPLHKSTHDSNEVEHSKRKYFPKILSVTATQITGSCRKWGLKCCPADPSISFKANRKRGPGKSGSKHHQESECWCCLVFLQIVWQWSFLPGRKYLQSVKLGGLHTCPCQLNTKTETQKSSWNNIQKMQSLLICVTYI